MKKINDYKLRIVDYKFLYTILIVLVYLVGKSIPLMGVDVTQYKVEVIEAESVLLQSISGDINRVSLLALGISPYMLAGIIVQMIAACQKADNRSKISPKKTNRFTLGLTLIFATFMAILRTNTLTFVTTGSALTWNKIAVVIEMITGAMLILWLSDRNKQFGIGGQTALIFINITDGLMANLLKARTRDAILPLILGICSMIIMIIMENSEKRIRVQRVSIHNIYSDKNYIAFKLNPIGVMPAMFATAFLMLPKGLVALLLMANPESERLHWVKANMNVDRPLGIVMYIATLFFLTILFSVVFVSPRDITENLMKSGDCIPGLHAGKDTKRYLKKSLIHLGIGSATVMSICLVIPMILRLHGLIDGTLMMLPTSMMMLTGITCTLRQEIIAVRNLDAYEPFI